jgi:hypothetical protein
MTAVSGNPVCRRDARRGRPVSPAAREYLRRTPALQQDDEQYHDDEQGQ